MSLLDNSDPLMATTMASRASGKTAWMSCLDTLGPEVQEVGKVVTPQTADLAILLPLQAEVQYGWKAEHPELLATPDLARRIAQSLDKSVSFDGLSKYELTAKLREYSDALEQKVEAAQKGSATALASNVDVVALKNAAKTCADKANNAALYAPALNIGFGRLYRGDPGHLSNFSEGGDVLWMSGRYPITEVQMGGGKVSGYLMLAAYARVSSGEFVATGNKTTPQIKADVQDYWGGLEYYSLTAKLAAQYGWTDTKATDSAQSALSRSGNRYLISAARPLGDKNAGLWVGVSYGTARGTIDTLKGKVFLITLDFAPPKPADILGLAKH